MHNFPFVTLHCTFEFVIHKVRVMKTMIYDTFFVLITFLNFPLFITHFKGILLITIIGLEYIYEWHTLNNIKSTCDELRQYSYILLFFSIIIKY